jgi:sterol desaturase/sphingolipid hydroxylase (fatty acid hydroxylase superfamily)
MFGIPISQQPDPEQGSLSTNDRGLHVNKETRFRYSVLFWGAWAIIIGFWFQKFECLPPLSQMNWSLVATDNLIAVWLVILGAFLVLLLGIPFWITAGLFRYNGFLGEVRDGRRLPVIEARYTTIEGHIFLVSLQFVLFLYFAAFSTGELLEKMGNNLWEL